MTIFLPESSPILGEESYKINCIYNLICFSLLKLFEGKINKNPSIKLISVKTY